MNDALTSSSVQTLERLMTQYGDAVLRTAYMLLNDRELAKDAAQESFLKAYRALSTLREDGSEKAWLMRIVMNTCKDILKSRWWRFVDRRISLDGLAEAGAEDQRPDPVVLTAVMSLPFKYRWVVLLHYYQGMTLNEIALALNTPPATARTWLKRAKERLRGQLEGWYFDE